MSGQRETIFATDSAWGNALKKKLRKISNGEKKALSFFKDVPWVEYIESKKLFIMFLRKIARWDSQTLFCLRRYPAKKKEYGGRHCSYFPIDGAGSRCAKIFSSPTIPPPQKKNTSARPSSVGPSVIHWNSTRPLAHSLTFPFLSFIFSPRSSIPQWDIFAGGNTRSLDLLFHASYHLRSRCCFPPFFSSYGGFAIENKLFSSLLILSLLSLFAPVCFPWESGDSTDWGGRGR